MNRESPADPRKTNGTSRQDIGDRLRRLRKSAKLTQSEVGAKLRVSKQAVSNWEKGIHAPSRRHRIALADLYGVRVEELPEQYNFIPDDTAAGTYRRTDVNPAKLTEARKDLSLTQREAGIRTGLSRNIISQYETGDRTPSSNAMLKLAEAYGKPLAWFMKNDT